MFYAPCDPNSSLYELGTILSGKEDIDKLNGTITISVYKEQDIPSDSETVTSEKAGEVYYSDPNRIVLFYRDAEITGEYTRIGTFDATDDFVAAVEEKQNDNISK